jgi:hypothetical protein
VETTGRASAPPEPRAIDERAPRLESPAHVLGPRLFMGRIELAAHPAEAR